LYKKVSIIIQARSTSSRFPGKIFERIGNKQILQHVLDACDNCAAYINKYSHSHGLVCGVAIAVPENDMLIPHYSKYKIIEGSESDVLGRYVTAAEQLESDYVVRITSDCPFIPPYIISKAINFGVKENYDFITNADPRFRTSPDGHDCEVMSRRLLVWLGENAKKPEHREHVTNYLLEQMPAWAKKVDIIGFADFSSIKLSVDTREDLERLTAMYEKLYAAVKNSPKSFRL
jgi:spore coat polysaccharide biosynthesis protein SpsF